MSDDAGSAEKEMTDDQNYPPQMYWHNAWRERIRANFFSPYRAIPSVLAFIAQFAWKHQPRTPFAEMWVGAVIIVGVYLVIFVIESLWKFVVLTPPKIYAEQVDAIGEAVARNSVLERQLQPEVSAAEERRRTLVGDKIKDFTSREKEILRYCLTSGTSSNMALEVESGFDLRDINSTLSKAIPRDLIVSFGERYSISRDFASALDYLLSTEGL